MAASYGCVTALSAGSATGGEDIACTLLGVSQEGMLLWPLCQSGEGLREVEVLSRYVCRDGCCASQEGRNVPAVPEASSPNLLAPAWPTLGSANSADGVSSNTSGTVNRMKGNARGSGETREMHYFLRINIRHSF